VLATVEWETAQTFKPVREAFWLNEEWRRQNLRYYPYYGRGYVQLTWRNNYAKYSQILGVDLVEKPDLAMDNNIALFVLVHGFKTGTFTGRKITEFINTHQADFVNARRCINGRDRAHDIAQLAEKYLKSL
jgi:predicted chitinase